MSAGNDRQLSAGHDRGVFVISTLTALRCGLPRLGALSRRLMLALVVVAVVAPAALAAVGLGPAKTLRVRFGNEHTASSSGLFLRITGQPPDAAITEAPAVRQTLMLPRGTRLRLKNLPQCRASRARIAAEGAEGACPVRTRVGSGGADGVLNGAPVHFDIGIYAVRRRLVFAAERGGKPLKQSFDGIAHGTQLVLTVPTLGGQIAPTGFDARIPARTGRAAWLLTPAGCPQSGHWTVVGRFQGVSSADAGARPVTHPQTLVDHVPCR